MILNPLAVIHIPFRALKVQTTQELSPEKICVGAQKMSRFYVQIYSECGVDKKKSIQYY